MFVSMTEKKLAIEFAPNAETNLGEIEDFIEKESGSEIAVRVIDEILKVCGSLQTMPRIGRAREDISPGVRSITSGDFVIYYRIKARLAVLWPLPKGLFKESDTYWLIEVGRNILHHFALPTTDPYSFASLHTPWIVYQWLTEVVLALANTFALKGVAILGEVSLGLLLCVLIFRRMIKLGDLSL